MRMRINRNYSNEMQGHPQTRQRHLLLELIREANGHIDAKELFRLAVNKDSSISPATVYRSLNLFKQLGLIDEQRLGKHAVTTKQSTHLSTSIWFAAYAGRSSILIAP